MSEEFQKSLDVSIKEADAGDVRSFSSLEELKQSVDTN